MPVEALYNSKNGLVSLNRTARAMCRIVTAYAPIIRAQYPENANLMLALTAAETACTLIVPETDSQIALDTAAAQTFDPAIDYAYPGRTE